MNKLSICLKIHSRSVSGKALGVCLPLPDGWQFEIELMQSGKPTPVQILIEDNTLIIKPLT